MIECNFIKNNIVRKCHELRPGTIFTPANVTANKTVLFQVSNIDSLPDDDGRSVYIFHGDPDYVICQRLHNGMLTCIHTDTDCIVYNVTMELTPEVIK